MRCAILSDIHGNLEALLATLDDILRFTFEQRAPLDAIWCLGDIVGYGPDPSECVQVIRERCSLCIAGNHDWAAIGKIDLDDFSDAAASSAEWTGKQLSMDARMYLRSLPERITQGDFTLAHGSPSNPIWEYLTTPPAAAANFAAFETPFCVVGHTHLPTIFLQAVRRPAQVSVPLGSSSIPDAELFAITAYGSNPRIDSGILRERAELTPRCEQIVPAPGLWLLPPGHRAIINPGSVGQPRDGDPRASYLIYDSAIGFEFRRVAYDIPTTQRKMQDSGLPARMAARLARGV